ncbi:MAG: preprotein translocase subunit SecG [Prevotella sp.]|jgi:preprotein translocase subunit SecG|nr:preprotein translocase subunit SecG [Prevotella sp.]
MYYLFVILIVLAALLMIGIVLIQESKGGGLSSNFSAGNALAGVRKTTDFIEKATWGLAIAMVVLSIFCAYSAPESASSSTIEATSGDPNAQQNFGVPQAPAAQGDQAAAPAKEGEAAPAAPAKEGEAPAQAAPAQNTNEAPAAPAQTAAPAEKQ